MKCNQLKFGAVLSYVQMAVSVLVGFLYTPVMLRLLGQAEYGLYNTVASTISMMSILNLGFSSSYIRYYSRYKNNQDDQRMASLNGLFLIVFSIIGVVALLCGLFLSNHLRLVFDQGLTDAEYVKARILMILLTVNMAVSFPMMTFTCIISAHEKYVFLKLMGLVKTVISPFLTLPLLLMGFRSLAMAAVTVVVSVAVDLAYLVYVRRTLGVRFRFHGFEKGIFANIMVFSSFIAIQIVVDQINNNMDKFLLGRFVGTEEVAVYTVGYTLYHYYMLFSVGISSVFSPKIHRIVNTTLSDHSEQKKLLTGLFTRVGRVQFLILALIATGLVFFGKEFVTLWADVNYVNAYYVALLLIIPATIPFIQNVGIEIQRALNKHWFSSICYFIMALINLAVSVKLCQIYGAVGCALGTGVSFILANGVIINIFYHKRCNIDILAFWKELLRLSRGLIIPILAGCLMKYVWRFDSWHAFILGVLLYTLAYSGSMWLMGMNDHEKGMVKSVLLHFGFRRGK